MVYDGAVSDGDVNMADGKNAIARLDGAMKSLGMNPDGLSITYSEELVGYPGGSFMNHLITVACGGKTEHFCAVLTEKSPLVTAWEIQRYFGVKGE